MKTTRDAWQEFADAAKDLARAISDFIGLQKMLRALSIFTEHPFKKYFR